VNLRKIFLPVMCLMIFAGCATQRPVLYPDEQLKRVGSVTANRDIDDWMQQAESYVSADSRTVRTSEDAVTHSGTDAAVGATAGAAGGAVIGRAGTGAAAGVAGGGVAGATRGLIHGLTRKEIPSPVYKNFFTRCLRDKGYDPIGWN
jgi:hypothetical protein